MAGLTPNVTMNRRHGRPVLAGRAQASSQPTSHSRFQTAFDLASYLANHDGVRSVCRTGKPSSAHRIRLQRSANTHTLDYSRYRTAQPDPAWAPSGLHFTRDYQIAKGVVVHVTAWDSRQRSRVEYYWSVEGGSTKKAEKNGNLHSFTLPGARLDQVQQYAQAEIQPDRGARTHHHRHRYPGA
ncbi:hypothetical protein ACOZ4Y_02420 [Komagataeibacter rhaeticus]